MKGKKQALLDKYGFVLYNGSVAPSTLVENQELYELVQEAYPLVWFITLDVLAFSHDTVYALASCCYDEEELDNCPRRLIRISNFDTSSIKVTAEIRDDFGVLLAYRHVVMFFRVVCEECNDYVIRCTNSPSLSEYVYDEKSGFYILRDLKLLFDELKKAGSL